MLLSYWTSRFREREIQLSLEPVIRQNYDINPIINTDLTILTFRLFDLIVQTGLINTRKAYLPPSRKYAFRDKADLLQYISREYQLSLNDGMPNQRAKQTISEDFGVGISILTVDQLFGIDWSTLSYIDIGTGRKPDFICNSRGGETIAFEAKGSMSKNYINRALRNSVNNQKAEVTADVNLAIGVYLTTSNSRDNSNITVLDPPTNNKDEKNQTALLKARHYTRAFNYVDQYELARYYYLMEKRIKFDRNFPEYPEKLELFNKLKKGYERILIHDIECVGNLKTMIRNGKSTLVFQGIREDLLRLDSMFKYKGIEGLDPIIDENQYLKIYPDGICFGIIDNKRVFNKIKIKEKPYWE